MSSILKQFIVVLMGFIALTSTAQSPLYPHGIEGKAYILMEADSEVILAQRNANQRMEPASITKLMTAYVVYQSIHQGIISLDDKVVISARARSMGGSRMFLERGSHVSINNLLSGLVIQSGNDAAVALAEAIAGDEALFVEMMNKQAQALGLKNSQFKNVTGLPEAGHYMSAHDIALLSRAIIRDFPTHYKRYGERSFAWNNITQDNRNTLLKSELNVDGLKTGHTEAAGYCLAASAKRGNMRLISVVLGTSSAKARAQESRKLLTYGFGNFRNQTIYQSGETISKARVENGAENSVNIVIKDTLTLPLPTDKPMANLKIQLVLDSIPKAPLAQGTTVGYLDIQRDGVTLAQIPALTATSVEKIGFFQRLWRTILNSVTGWFA